MGQKDFRFTLSLLKVRPVFRMMLSGTTAHKTALVPLGGTAERKKNDDSLLLKDLFEFDSPNAIGFTFVK